MQLYDVICQGKYNTYWFEIVTSPIKEFGTLEITQEFQVIDKEEGSTITSCETWDEVEHFFDDYTYQEWIRS